MDSSMKGNASLYEKVKYDIIAQIESGKLQVGDKILSEIQLQESYQVSRITVRKAVSDLVKEGYLTKLQGKGTYVKRKDDIAKNVLSLTDLCAMQGKKLESEVLCQAISSTPSEFLKYFPDEQVIEITRLRKVNGVPVMLESTYFSMDYQFLLYGDVSESLYQVLQEHKIVASYKGLNEVSIHHLEVEEAELFNVRDHREVILHKGTVYTDQHKLLHAVKELVRVDLPELFKYYL